MTDRARPDQLVLIVAMSTNRVIGRSGDLPWHISDDLKRFRRLTTGHTIIMGRKTYESIGRPLPDRRTIVITRQTDYHPEGVDVAHSLDEAIAMAASDSQAFICGGGEIYQQAVDRVDRIEMTLVFAEVEGDAFFPELPARTFSATHREEHRDHDPPFDFVTMVRQG